MRLPVLHERRSKLAESRAMMSTVSPVVTEPPAAARAGADLREARERLQLSLHDVSFTLRIRVPHLEALEEGRISLLPGNAYALAFVRTYANALGLDAEEMVRRFKTEASEFGRRTELVFPIPMPERGLPPGAVVLLGLVLVVGAYAGWYHLSGDGRLPAETVTAIPERLAPLAAQALPPSSATADPDATSTPTPNTRSRFVLSEPPVADVPTNPAPPVAVISPSSAAAAQIPSRSADVSPAAGVPVTAGMSPVAGMLNFVPPGTAAGNATTAPSGGASDSSRIVLRASADAWLLVKDRSGTILLNKVLKPGDVWSVPPRSDLLLTTGNAGGTDILLDGVPAPSLGAPGAVRRDLSLDPDQIKDGKLAAAAAMPLIVSTHQRQ
jgi:cytoskeleton protein RodZ